MAVLLFGKKIDAHCRGQFLGGAFRLVLLSGLKCCTVVAEAPAAERTLCRAVTEEELGGFAVVADNIWFSACCLHCLERVQRVGLAFKLFLNSGPSHLSVPGHVLLEPGLQ